MNKVILIGRLTKDPTTQGFSSKDGQSSIVARYNLAVDRRFKKDGDQNADFINCVTFGKTAEFTEKYLRKGTKVAVSGRIQTGSYKKDNQTIYTTDVVVEECEFAESKSNNADQPAPSPSNIGDGFMNIPDGIDEELPFL